MVGHQVDLAYGVFHDVTPDRILEGFVEEGVGFAFISVEHQIEGGGSGTVVAFSPILERVSPGTPKFGDA